MFSRARIPEALGGGIITCDGVMACSISGRLGRVHHISYLTFMCKTFGEVFQKDALAWPEP